MCAAKPDPETIQGSTLRATQWLKWQIGFALLVTLLSVRSLRSSENLTELVRRANSAMQKDSFIEAEALYRTVLVQAPDLAEIRSNLGLALHMQGKFELAEREFQTVLRSSPGLFVPNYFLGVQNFKTNRYSKARTFLERAIAIQPSDREARRWLAATYVGLRLYEEALRQYRDLLKQERSDVESLYAIGKIFTTLMQRSFTAIFESPNTIYRGLLLAEAVANSNEGRQLASAELTRLIKADPAVPLLRLELAKLKLQGEELEEAKDLLQEELAIDSWSFEARYGLAQVSLASGQYDAFDKQFEEAVRIRPEFFCPPPPLWREFPKSDFASALTHSLSSLSVGFIAAKSGSDHSFCQLLAPYRLTKARARNSTPDVLFREKLYEAAIELLENPKGAMTSRPSNRLLLAKCYFQVGRWEESAKLASTLTNVPESGLAALYLAGKSYQRLALGSFADLDRVAPDSYRADQLRGEASLATQDFKAAISAFESALQRKPSAAELHYQLGHALYLNSEPAEASASLNRSLELDPRNAEANFLIGKMLMEQNQSGEAVAFLMKAQELDPSLLEAHAQLGKAYTQMNQWDAAVRHLELASTSDTDGGLHYQLFRAYTKLDQKGKAQVALAKSENLKQAKLERDRARMAPAVP
jgi:tetratricopeptide (TPR) repeat protein